jgi:hypothetical protein
MVSLDELFVEPMSIGVVFYSGVVILVSFELPVNANTNTVVGLS